MLAVIVLFCFRVSVGGKFCGVVQIDNIFLLADFCGLYLVVWLGVLCYFYRSDSKKFKESFTVESTVGLSSWFSLRSSGEKMHL